MRQRRESRVAPNPFGRPSNLDLPSQHRPGRGPHDKSPIRRRQTKGRDSSGEESNEEDRPDTSDRTPLLAGIFNRNEGSPHRSGYGMYGGQARTTGHETRHRRNSNASSNASKHRMFLGSRQNSTPGIHPVHDVNNPPSVPNSPKIGTDLGYDDVFLASSYTSKPSEERRGDQLIDIDEETRGPSPVQRRESMDIRRHTVPLTAEEDVCFPVEGMSAIGEEDYHEHGQEQQYQQGPRKRRYRQWPDLSVLDEWSREEKEQQSEGIRTKKISEPVLVGGRLRPQKHGWHKEEEDAPYRFTYFNEEFPSTIHSQTISELLQPGQDFKELFIPDPPELSDYSSDEEEISSHRGPVPERQELSPLTQSQAGTRHSSIIGGPKGLTPVNSGDATPSNPIGPTAGGEKPKRYGERPTFWLDVLSPTEIEMRVIAKAFGIHPLTAEDIMMQEAREKVELFRNYYFVNYRTFEQDTNSEEFLEPVNMYVVVFPEGVISFHFSMTPHPANVRRRIRQLRDYIKVSSDWISYAIIDDITDVFAPLIHNIEEEVDDIDDAILKLHSIEGAGVAKSGLMNEKASNDGKSISSVDTISGGDMLRRVGEGRKKVMLLYRLLGNKADVIKGFAKRCNEKWDIAPRSDIGLYLGDIQDHILTMTGNLNHYETSVFSSLTLWSLPSIRLIDSPCPLIKTRATANSRALQPAIACPLELPRSDQHRHERTSRTNRRCLGKAYCTRYNCPADEHRHRNVGNERASPRAGC